MMRCRGSGWKATGHLEFVLALRSRRCKDVDMDQLMKAAFVIGLFVVVYHLS